jgi:hypothetical protein
MPRIQPSDEEVIAQAKEALASCNPSIEFNSIEEGDFTDGRRFVALIGFYRDGNAVLSEKKLKVAFHIQALLTKAFQEIAGKSTIPDFRIQKITGCDREETVKLLRWIFNTCGGQGPKRMSSHAAWVKRLGIIAEGNEPVLTVSTVAALAEKFGLRGEPFAAFRKAGIEIPDDPNAAIAAIYRAANGGGPNNVSFVHDNESESEFSRIQNVIQEVNTDFNSMNLESLNSRQAIVTEQIEAVSRLRNRLAQVRATEALKDRTNKTLDEMQNKLQRLQRSITARTRVERQKKDDESKAGAEIFARKAESAEGAIANIKARAEQRTPDTIMNIQKRIQSLKMDLAEQYVNEAASDANCNEERIASIRLKLTEATYIVARRRSELEEMVRQTQMKSRLAYEKFTREKTILLEEIEKAIDVRTGDFESRCNMLRSQYQLLREQNSELQAGHQLEQNLRDHCVEDCEPKIGFITIFEAEIVRLRKKLDSVMHEEEEFEKERKQFVRNCSQARENCESIQTRIDLFTFKSLKTVKDQQSILSQLRISLEKHLNDVNDSWTKLCELRSLSGQDDVDSVRNCTCEMIKLCDQTIPVVNAAVTRLEQEAIDNFSLLIQECKSALASTNARVLGLLPDPQSRLEPLRQMISELQSRKDPLMSSYRYLQDYTLHQRIDQSDIVFMNQFSDSIDAYSREMGELHRYMSIVSDFHTVNRQVQFDVLALQSLLDHQWTSQFPETNRVNYNRLVQDSYDQLGRLGNAWRLVIGEMLARCMPIPPDIEGSFILIREEYSRILDGARRRIDQQLRLAQNDSDVRLSRNKIQFKVNRANVVDEFIAFAEKNYSGYQGEGIRTYFIDEPGIDCGGLTRELFNIVSAPLFKKAFSITEKGNLFWLPRNDELSSGRLTDLIAAGFLVRLAIEANQPIRMSLPLALFVKLRNFPIALPDLYEISPVIASNILIARRDCCVNGKCIELYFMNGDQVTAELFDMYISEQVKMIMDTEVSIAFDAFRKGFFGEYESDNIAKLTPSQLHARATGNESIDWAEMKRSCILRCYSEGDLPVVLFWSVFDQLSEEDKTVMLRFITGNDRPPAHGFQPSPITLIRVGWNQSSRSPLPVAHTCFRRLDLPAISDEETMRWAFRICIDNSQGFGIC